MSISQVMHTAGLNITYNLDMLLLTPILAMNNQFRTMSASMNGDLRSTVGNCSVPRVSGKEEADNFKCVPITNRANGNDTD